MVIVSLVLLVLTAEPGVGSEEERHTSPVDSAARIQGNISYRRGDLDSAIEAYKKSLILHPNLPNLIDKFNLAILYGKRYTHTMQIVGQAERIGNRLDAEHLRRQAASDRQDALKLTEVFLGEGDSLEARMLVLRTELGIDHSPTEFDALIQGLNEPKLRDAYTAIEAARIFDEPAFLEDAIEIAHRYGDREAFARAIIARESPLLADLHQAILEAQAARNHLLAAQGLLKIWEQKQDFAYLQQAYASLQEHRQQSTPIDFLSEFPDIERIHRLTIQELIRRQQ